MTPSRMDPDLELPRDASAVAEISAPGSGLVRACRADGGGLLLAGTRAVVRGSGLEGVSGVEGDGSYLIGRIHLEGPPAANLLVTPRTLVRERIGAGGGLRESVVVPERLPGAVVQWAGSAPPAGARLTVRLPARAIGGRHRIEGPRLRWTGPDDDAGGVLFLTGPVEGPWTLAEGPGSIEARALLRPAPGAPVTLLVTAVAPGARLPSLPALAAVAAHRRRDDLEPLEAPGVTLDTGVAELDDGVAWARAVLRGRIDESNTPPRLRGGGAADVVRGALAAGEWEVARAALAAVPPGPDEAEARALWVAWTAEPEPLLQARERLDPVLADAPAGLRRRVADAAEAAGDDAWAVALRRPAARAGGRRLPTVTKNSSGGGRSPSPSDGVAAEETASPILGAGSPAADRPGEADLRAALVQLGSDAPDAGLAMLRRALGALHRHGSSGEGAEAALILDLLVRGLLGVEPDAAYGRVRIAPVVPASWTRFRIGGIRVGDATLEVEMGREGGRHRFALRQRAGGAPVTWIFEPRLVGRTVAGVWVDGTPAAVDHERRGGRVHPRVQLPAERERIVEVEVSPP